MTKLKLTFAAVALAASAQVSADTILGVYAGGQRWDYDVEGTVRSGANDIDLKDDLGLAGEDNNTYFVALEHFVPFVPNFRVQQNNIEGSGMGTASQNFIFNGDSYLIGGDVVTNYDLSNTDFTLYYEILDNWVNLDLGITGKQFDGFVNVAGNAGGTPTMSNVDISGTIPMIYGKAQFDLPFTGFSAGAAGNFAAFGDDEMSDLSAYVAYESDSGLGLEVGYRTFELDFDEFDDLSTDLKLDGAYVSINYHF